MPYMLWDKIWGENITTCPLMILRSTLKHDLY